MIYKIIRIKKTSPFLNIKLVDLRCKHVLKLSRKGNKVLEISNKIGYKWCFWGKDFNRPGDINYHISVIKKMENENYNHSLRIVICDYLFSDCLSYWADNLHTCIKYIKTYGQEATLKDIPFYIILLKKKDIIVYSYKNYLRENRKAIEGAIHCAIMRKKWSNDSKLIDLNYSIKDFLRDNPKLLL